MKQPSCRFLLFCIFVPTFIGPEFAAAQSDEPFRAPARRDVDFLHIRLDLDVSLEKQSIAGSATLKFQTLSEIPSLTLDAVNLKVEAVYDTTDDKAVELEFKNTGEQLIITFPKPLARGTERTIDVQYSVTEPKTGLHFFRPTQSEPEVPYMVWSQGEPESNRYWFPCFDRPNERQTTELIARVDRRFTVLSNGELIAQNTIADSDKIEYHWKQNKPHVSYLVTLVVGEFAIIEKTWRGKPITYYVSPERRDDAETTFGRTPAMLDFFSEKFGIEYPWEKYAQVVVEQFTSGGMENTSATTLYEGVMHDKRALLTSSPDRLIAHELGHQWWGDLVTCQDWTHLWLNEGFATYCEVLWAEHALGKDERDFLLYGKSQSARTGTPTERPIVDRRYPSPGTMFDSRAYPKGGWVLHMLRHRLGDADFFRGLKRYGLEYSYKTAETSDFRKVYEQLYGVSLERFFHDWTERKGHPKLRVSTTYQAEDSTVRIQINQTQDDAAFAFPLKIELTKAGRNGKQIFLEPNIREKEQTLVIPVVSRPNLVRIDPLFALLADIEEEKSRDWWIEQLHRAPSVPERLRAVAHFGAEPSSENRAELITCFENDKFYGVRVAAAKALAKTGHESARETLLAHLNDEHPEVRLGVAQALGEFKEDAAVINALTDFLKTNEPSYHVKAAAIDSLVKVSPVPPRKILEEALEEDSHREVIRTKAIAGLAKCADVEALATLRTWSERGHHRTARMAAIQAIAKSIDDHEFPEDRESEAVKQISSYLKETGPRIRRSALQALSTVPDLAKKEKVVIERLSEFDPDNRVRIAATAALKKFVQQPGESTQVKKLQSELDDLKKQYEKLEKQIKTLQTK